MKIKWKTDKMCRSSSLLILHRLDRAYHDTLHPYHNQWSHICPFFILDIYCITWQWEKVQTLLRSSSHVWYQILISGMILVCSSTRRPLCIVGSWTSQIFGTMRTPSNYSTSITKLYTSYCSYLIIEMIVKTNGAFTKALGLILSRLLHIIFNLYYLKHLRNL